MSIILDALRKSDASRPAPEQQRLAPAPLRRRGPPGWLWMLLGMAGIALASALLAKYVFAPAAEADSPTRIMENGGPAAEIRPLSEVARERSRTTSSRLAGMAAEVTNSPAQEPGGVRRKSVNEPDDETASAQDDAVVAPWLSDMPADYRINVPELTINALAYAENPAERFVLINLRRYTEGDRLQEGPRLLQIQDGAVILEYRDRKFALSTR